jgi:hypothetical protein
MALPRNAAVLGSLLLLAGISPAARLRHTAFQFKPALFDLNSL